MPLRVLVACRGECGQICSASDWAKTKLDVVPVSRAQGRRLAEREGFGCPWPGPSLSPSERGLGALRAHRAVASRSKRGLGAPGQGRRSCRASGIWEPSQQCCPIYQVSLIRIHLLTDCLITQKQLDELAHLWRARRSELRRGAEPRPTSVGDERSA